MRRANRRLLCKETIKKYKMTISIYFLIITIAASSLTSNLVYLVTADHTDYGDDYEYTDNEGAEGEKSEKSYKEVKTRGHKVDDETQYEEVAGTKGEDDQYDNKESDEYDEDGDYSDVNNNENEDGTDDDNDEMKPESDAGSKTSKYKTKSNYKTKKSKSKTKSKPQAKTKEEDDYYDSVTNEDEDQGNDVPSATQEPTEKTILQQMIEDDKVTGEEPTEKSFRKKTKSSQDDDEENSVDKDQGSQTKSSDKDYDYNDIESDSNKDTPTSSNKETAADTSDSFHTSTRTSNSKVRQALHSYTQITKQSLNIGQILELYESKDEETLKFVKNVLKALKAINRAKMNDYHGFDWPEDVVNMLKRFHPNKSNNYIARFLNHYYRRYSGAHKQYLRMKVRLLSTKTSDPNNNSKKDKHETETQEYDQDYEIEKRDIPTAHRRKKQPHRNRSKVLSSNNDISEYQEDDDDEEEEGENSSNTYTAEDSKDPNSCDSCDIMEDEEVCGADGRTYNSICHAVNCGRLKFTDVRLGKCEEKNPCDSNTCSRHQMCVPKVHGTCLSLYNSEGKKVPCKQYKCISKRRCTKLKGGHVCGSDGVTYSSLCSLYRHKVALAYRGPCNSNKCSRQVCGSNGITYETSCHAKTRSVRIDYTGACVGPTKDGWSSHKDICKNVRESKRCNKIPPSCKKWIIPEGSCCPICGASINVRPNVRALSGMGKANRLYNIQKLILQRLIPHKSKEKCHTSITYLDEGLLTIVLEPYNVSKGESVCTRTALKLAKRINHPLSRDSHVIKKLGPAEYRSPSKQ